MKSWIFLLVLVVAGCSIMQVEDTITGVADGAVGTTIVTAGTAVANFLPPPWGTAILALTNLFVWVRGRRYKKALGAVVEGVGEVLGGMKPEDAVEAKNTLKRVATENNMKPTINAVVDKVKAA